MPREEHGGGVAQRSEAAADRIQSEAPAHPRRAHTRMIELRGAAARLLLELPGDALARSTAGRFAHTQRCRRHQLPLVSVSTSASGRSGEVARAAALSPAPIVKVRDGVPSRRAPTRRRRCRRAQRPDDQPEAADARRRPPSHLVGGRCVAAAAPTARTLRRGNRGDRTTPTDVVHTQIDYAWRRWSPHSYPARTSASAGAERRHQPREHLRRAHRQLPSRRCPTASGSSVARTTRVPSHVWHFDGNLTRTYLPEPDTSIQVARRVPARALSAQARQDRQALHRTRRRSVSLVFYHAVNGRTSCCLTTAALSAARTTRSSTARPAG